MIYTTKSREEDIHALIIGSCTVDFNVINEISGILLSERLIDSAPNKPSQLSYNGDISNSLRTFVLQSLVHSRSLSESLLQLIIWHGYNQEFFSQSGSPLEYSSQKNLELPVKTLKIYGTVFWEGINTHRKGSTVARASNWVGLDQVKINASGSQQLKVQVNNDELIHGPSHVCLKIVVLECLISEVTLLCNTIWLGNANVAVPSTKDSRLGSLIRMLTSMC